MSFHALVSAAFSNVPEIKFSLLFPVIVYLTKGIVTLDESLKYLHRLGYNVASIDDICPIYPIRALACVLKHKRDPNVNSKWQ